MVKSSNSNLDSSTIHSEDNKNIKDRVQTNEVKIEPRKSNAYAYEDMQDIFLSRTNSKPNIQQTTDGSKSSSPKHNIFNDVLRSSGRLSSCDGCSKIITDDEMVNIFLNKKWTNEKETDDSNVKFEVVGKSVPQAKRFQIYENVDPIPDEATNETPQQEETIISSISIPVRPSSKLKSEVFIMVNDDHSISGVDGADDVFK